jgi:FkbH-like protein
MPTSADIIDRYLAKVTFDGDVRSELISSLKSDIKGGNAERVATLFPRLVVPGLDYTTATALHRLLKQVRQTIPTKPTTKIAVLGSVTTRQLIDLIDLYLQTGRINAEFYESDYGTIHQEFLDPNSGLYDFRPDLALIIPTWRDLHDKPRLNDSQEEVRTKVDGEVATWTTLWRNAESRLKCQVIQSNFALPPWRVMGNLETRHPAGFSRYISLVNHALADAAPLGVTIHDVDQLASAAGRWAWSDERFFHQAKLPCSPEHLVDYAHSLASLIIAQLGAARKCLVLDLDNTLWGGVIGDDGLGGIRLGQGDPEGEAFIGFQRYVKSLGARGVILAVCSKNDDAIAREVFEKHSEMVLRLEDISCFVANWDDKAANLARIAERLNIGINSLVFFDDNPAERSIVRQLQPDVAVPEVPAEPAHYIRALDTHRYFEAMAISAEDLKRTQFYRADLQRQELESTVSDVDSFLKSIDMVARIGPVVDATLERTVQLINRSNQFNLTTRRYSNADLIGLLSNESWMTRTISLCDRFGDNGLISVLLAREDGDALVIDTWVMSCRVLKRGVERLLLNSLAAYARSRGLGSIVGEYIPTQKNGLVRDHYRNLGFSPMGNHQAGPSRWELRVDNEWSPLEHFIRESIE